MKPLMVACSVIICTHNPRADYLERTLNALAAQTLSTEQWELLLIDNASAEPLLHKWELSWHPFARHIREEELGLTHARLRGIKEANGKLLVFVDDDNVLAQDYLEAALAVSLEYPQLGTFGAARIIPEYEKQPRPELRQYCNMLALRNEPRDLWANLPTATAAVPFGAGLCLRIEVAQSYLKKKQLGGGIILGRMGSNLVSAEDIEIALATTDIGLGYGIFACLMLTHLIPARRVEQDYLLRLGEGITFSNELLSRLRDHERGQPEPSLKRELRLMLGALFKIVASKGIHRRFSYKSCRARWLAFQEYRRLTKQK